MLGVFAVPLTEDDNVIPQQDGAPAHYAKIVTEFLGETFPRHWSGKQWPPSSPDLTPLDFYFWAYVKQIVYAGHGIQLRC